MKDIAKIIKEFENLPYKGCVRKSPKYEPTDCYFYHERHLSKYIKRDDALNSHIDPVRTEITGMKQIPISHVCSSDESKPKGIIPDEKLSQV